MSRRNVKQYPQSGGGWLSIPGVGIMFDSGPTVPADGSVGYGPGCLFIDNDAAGIASWWRNNGTFASSLFAQPLGGVNLSGLTTSVTELNLLTGLLATAAEMNRATKLSTRLIAAGSASLTVTLALHDGKTILLDQATGVAVTLPAMTGSGARYRFVCSVATSGGSHVITATGAHLFGSLLVNTDSALAAGTLWTNGIATSPSGSTVITLDGSTKGGRKGDWFEIEDVATSIGIVRGFLNGSGTEATPFS